MVRAARRSIDVVCEMKSMSPFRCIIGAGRNIGRERRECGSRRGPDLHHGVDHGGHPRGQRA